jgi:ribosomal protein S18 acetylase RimI-like enzyme
MSKELTDRVRSAHGDAWQVEGRMREPFGGGATELPGVRLMASGLPFAWGNNGDVDTPSEVDLGVVRSWYAERGVPWGLRVPARARWAHGRRQFAKRCMGLVPERFAPAPLPHGVEIKPARPDDLDVVAEIDAAAFGNDVQTSRAWATPQFSSSAHIVALATMREQPLGIAVSVTTDGRAGPSVGIFGVAVAAHARRRGIGSALTSWLVERGLAGGAELVHLNPDTDDAARLYGRLGFLETDGFDVYTYV